MSKYHNNKVITDGMTFDSKKEAERYKELKTLERTGKIKNLQCQVRFELIPSQYIDKKCVERNCCYIADFVYDDLETNKKIVEDTKGFRTTDYKIKRKLMLYVHGIRIKEI